MRKFSEGLKKMKTCNK